MFHLSAERVQESRAVKHAKWTTVKPRLRDLQELNRAGDVKKFGYTILGVGLFAPGNSHVYDYLEELLRQLSDGGATPTSAKRHLCESSPGEFAQKTSMQQDDEGAIDRSVLGSKEDGDFTTVHGDENCTSAQKCVNCQQTHEATSSECPKLQKEKEICIFKVRENITLLEVAKVVEEQRKIKRRNKQHVEKPGTGSSQPKSQTTAQEVDLGAQGISSPAGAAKADNPHNGGRDNHARGLTFRDATQGNPQIRRRTERSHVTIPRHKGYCQSQGRQFQSPLSGLPKKGVSAMHFDIASALPSFATKQGLRAINGIA
ncbi:hypothetical protein HPB47_006595 [Ixodes persulcatus]|uniref:Uncharacterized protein n=1 Tax=Ixodes persulcatus TaxID=34615 RepID=A0AC60P9W2_IXOPE|nr:hypothetical protein HPB47_006595 [Ixodes persulcatus]